MHALLRTEPAAVWRKSPLLLLLQKKINLTKTVRKLPINDQLERAGHYLYDDRQLEIKYDDPSVRPCCQYLHRLPVQIRVLKIDGKHEVTTPHASSGCAWAAAACAAPEELLCRSTMIQRLTTLLLWCLTPCSPPWTATP